MLIQHCPGCCCCICTGHWGRYRQALCASSSVSTIAKKPPPKPSNPYANYSTAASLGYTDPDADRLAEEMRIRQTQGVAGEWQVVTSTAQQSVKRFLGYIPAVRYNSRHDWWSWCRVEKRGGRSPSRRRYPGVQVAEKTTDAGLGEVYDPGLIPIKVKKKEETTGSPLPGSSLTTESDPVPQTVGSSTSRPKWTTNWGKDLTKIRVTMVLSRRR
jgi:WW domain-binding protein 4